MGERIVIIGAGPTGLGAAWRLHEMGCDDWLLLEASDTPGGLAASVTDDKGFTWDFGGHVQFSHYRYFDDLMDTLLGPDGWLHHERESWVWVRDRFIPYPFQLNIRRLPHDEMKECVAGLVRLYKEGGNGRKPHHFGEWIDATFGAGIARVFMRPYNFKVWAYPPEQLDYAWIGERVAVVDLERVLNNIFDERDDVSWGPNNTFRFPLRGGTGAVWRECANRLPQERIRYGAEVTSINTAQRTLTLASGETLSYDRLLNTMPLDLLIGRSDLDALKPAASRLVHSSTHIFGVGLRGAPSPEISKKCWMYFPENNCPFYRVTVFSNYSHNNVPDIRQYWSLMAEVSESPAKPVPASAEERLEQVIQGMLNTRLIERREDIVDTWQARLEYGYPTPFLGRDRVLGQLLPALDAVGIASRGRFGAWRYEVSNQDHSLMQGVEWANRVLYGSEELTVWHPEIVNAVRPGLKNPADELLDSRSGRHAKD
jgi:protoporphyrinogen oxidase